MKKYLFFGFLLILSFLSGIWIAKNKLKMKEEPSKTINNPIAESLLFDEKEMALMQEDLLKMRVSLSKIHQYPLP